MPTQTPELPVAPVPGAAPPESDPVAQTMALLQPWIDYVPQRQRRLGLFIFLALLAHTAAFFFIRIDTTRAELRRQPRPHVTVENLQTASLAASQPSDDFWDLLNDPRLFLLPLQPPAGASPGEPAPDFAGIDANLGSPELPPAASPEGFQFVHPVNQPLEQEAGEAMIPPRQPFSYEEKPPAAAAKTTWQWDDGLARRQPTGVPDLPSPVSDTDLDPTRLRVAVGPGGAVEHVFVEQSCGSGRLDLDQLAVMAARKIRFKPIDEPGQQWGQITIFWYYAAKPSEEVVPTPPSAP